MPEAPLCGAHIEEFWDNQLIEARKLKDYGLVSFITIKKRDYSLRNRVKTPSTKSKRPKAYVWRATDVPSYYTGERRRKFIRKIV